MISTVQEVCKYVGSVINYAPFCIETGSTYCVEPSNLIHTTTNNIANYICLPNNGTLYSLDVEKEHQELAASVCDKNANVNFILGDSVETLRLLREFYGSNNLYRSLDVLWMDSKEFDEEHAVNEYNAVKHALSENHWVMMDDIHNTSSVKWKKVVPILKDLGYSYIEVSTPTGLFVATKGYKLPF